jgi:hypothetical protein
MKDSAEFCGEWRMLLDVEADEGADGGTDGGGNLASEIKRK